MTLSLSSLTDLDQVAEYILIADHVIVGENLELLSPGYVHVRSGLIVDAAQGKPETQLPIFELPGHLLMPGLINSHTHIGDTVVKELGYGVPSDVNLLWQPDGLRHVRMAGLQRSDRVRGIRSALRRALETGTVALADFREGGIEGIHELQEAASTVPIQCLSFGRMSEYPLHDASALLDNRDGLTASQLSEIDRLLDVADGFSPLWANDSTDLGLTQMAEVVRGRGKLLATHAGETGEYRRLSIERTGRGDVERIVDLLKPDFVVHMTSATDEELELTATAGIPLVMCARTQAALGYGIPPYIRAVERGATVGLGTDNAMISSPDLLDELAFMSRSIRSIAGDPAIVDPRTLLASVTINAARMLKLDDRLGSISPGKAASMLAVDVESDNLVDSVNLIASIVDRASPTDLRAVIIDGKLAYENPRVHSV